MNTVEAIETKQAAIKPVTELSGGELQRVLLARVFAGEPAFACALTT